jgi:DNA replication protein DnaC
LVQAIGREVLKTGFLVFYRSIFDPVRELLSQETQASEGRLLKKYLKPDLLIIDDMGLKILPQKSGGENYSAMSLQPALPNQKSGWF